MEPDALPPTAPSAAEAAQRREEFVQLLAAEQTRLLHYVTMLLGDPHEAQNVVQEANLVLWRKADDFALGTNFTAWSRKVAYWQVQAFVRDRQRDRLVFDEQLAEQLASIDSDESVGAETRLALRHCVSGLRGPQRRMLALRYDRGMPIKQLAERLERSPSSVKVGLLRIRRLLLRCIERKLATDGG
ncbi:MAG: sigma-70 family RNA polymerase sigma factor [Lacipirellulaceae bacterium]